MKLIMKCGGISKEKDVSAFFPSFLEYIMNELLRVFRNLLPYKHKIGQLFCKERIYQELLKKLLENLDSTMIQKSPQAPDLERGVEVLRI